MLRFPWNFHLYRFVKRVNGSYTRNGCETEKKMYQLNCDAMTINRFTGNTETKNSMNKRGTFKRNISEMSAN